MKFFESAAALIASSALAVSAATCPALKDINVLDPQHFVTFNILDKTVATSFEHTVKVNTPSSQDHIFYAITQYFQHSSSSYYIGIQPHSDGTAGVRFSVFGDGTKHLDHNNCAGGADYGSGTSCGLDGYKYTAGHDYKFRVEKTSSSGGQDAYKGTITDVASGKTTQIGEWSVPSTRGGLKSGMHGFIEQYNANIGTCASLPPKVDVEYKDINFNGNSWSAPISNKIFDRSDLKDEWPHGTCRPRFDDSVTSHGSSFHVTATRMDDHCDDGSKAVVPPTPSPSITPSGTPASSSSPSTSPSASVTPSPLKLSANSRIACPEVALQAWMDDCDNGLPFVDTKIVPDGSCTKIQASGSEGGAKVTYANGVLSADVYLNGACFGVPVVSVARMNEGKGTCTKDTVGGVRVMCGASAKTITNTTTTTTSATASATASPAVTPSASVSASIVPSATPTPTPTASAAVTPSPSSPQTTTTDTQTSTMVTAPKTISAPSASPSPVAVVTATAFGVVTSTTSALATSATPSASAVTVSATPSASVAAASATPSASAAIVSATPSASAAAVSATPSPTAAAVSATPSASAAASSTTASSTAAAASATPSASAAAVTSTVQATTTTMSVVPTDTFTSQLVAPTIVSLANTEVAAKVHPTPASTYLMTCGTRFPGTDGLNNDKPCCRYGGDRCDGVSKCMLSSCQSTEVVPDKKRYYCGDLKYAKCDTYKKDLKCCKHSEKCRGWGNCKCESTACCKKTKKAKVNEEGDIRGDSDDSNNLLCGAVPNNKCRSFKENVPCCNAGTGMCGKYAVIKCSSSNCCEKTKKGKNNKCRRTTRTGRCA